MSLSLFEFMKMMKKEKDKEKMNKKHKKLRYLLNDKFVSNRFDVTCRVAYSSKG